MRFMVLVKSDERSEAGVLPDEKLLSEMGSYNEGLIERGAMLAGEGLKPSSLGVRVRISRENARYVDGPFAESKELVAGYWLLQFASYDEAIRALERAPFAGGTLELRPLYESEDFALSASEQPGGWRDQEEAARPASQPARIPGSKRFLCMLKADAHTEGEDEATPELLAEMGALIAEMSEAGVLLMGEGLKPSRHGKRICFDAGRRAV
ncbi:MAG TPA: YciI family protein, partial [Polyangiales bacterium]|nr:YciI family protein [Polyangiales bacterium]